MRLILSLSVILILLLSSHYTNAQKGCHPNDCPINPFGALSIYLDSADTNNIWMIGKPHKFLFNSAYVGTNALMTDTLYSYPDTNKSSFLLKADMNYFWMRLSYIQLIWVQKIDMDYGKDGGIIEASYDNGKTWVNVFTDTNGRSQSLNQSLDTLYNGEVGVTGVDNSWKTVGICWLNNYDLDSLDSLYIRFTFISDTFTENREGWIIDNMYITETYSEKINIPFNTDTIIGLQPNPLKTESYITIELDEDSPLKIDLYDLQGRYVLNIIDKQENKGIHIYPILNGASKPASGVYILKCTTNQMEHSKKLLILSN